MERNEVLGTAARLGTSVDALAALAAHIRLETEDLPADPQVRSLLAAIAREVLGTEATGAELAASGDALTPVVGLAKTFVLQAGELIDNPGRSGSWDQVNPPLLQSIGRLSAAIADAIVTAEGSLEGLGTALSGPSARFLDIGTGTGWIAMGMARKHPELDVVGIDLFEPALELARGNVEAQGLSGRVTLRLEDALDLDEPDGYDAIWVPLPFLPESVVPGVLAAAVRSLRPGGWVLPGTFAGPGDALAELLSDLRTVRSGGRPWRSDEVAELLASAGLVESQEVTRTWPAPLRLYGGRRP